jgi:hypothetical protein
MDKEIDEVRTLLAKSRVSVVACLEDIVAHIVSQSSPFSTLPLDIFLDIIYLTSPGPLDAYAPPLQTSKVKAPQHPLLAPRSVCRGWRNAIDTTPWLWHTLVMHQDPPVINPLVVFPSWINKALGTDEEKEAGREGPGFLHLVLVGRVDWATCVVQRLEERGSLKRLVSCTLEATGSHPSDAISTSIVRDDAFHATLASACSTTLRRLRYRNPLSSGPNLEADYLATTFPHLQHLSISASYIPTSYSPTTNVDVTPPILRLTDLSLKYIRALNDIPLSLLSLPTLKRVTIAQMDNLRECRPGESSRMWESIEELSLSSRLASVLVDLAISNGSTLPRLTRLTLDSALLTSSRLDLFNSTNAPNLSHLSLRSTGTSQRRLVLPPMVKLTTLNLSATSWVNDTFIDDLVLKTPMLERINLSGSPKITGPPIMRLVRSRIPPASTTTTTSTSKPIPFYSRLVELNLQDCPGVDNASVDWLKKYVRPKGLTTKFSREKR